MSAREPAPPVTPPTTEGMEARDFFWMWDASPVCMLIHDAQTKEILWANAAACRMLEFSVTELKPLKAPDMSSPARQYDRAIGLAWLSAAVGLAGLVAIVGSKIAERRARVTIGISLAVTATALIAAFGVLRTFKWA